MPRAREGEHYLGRVWPGAALSSLDQVRIFQRSGRRTHLMYFARRNPRDTDSLMLSRNLTDPRSYSSAGMLSRCAEFTMRYDNGISH